MLQLIAERFNFAGNYVATIFVLFWSDVIYFVYIQWQFQLWQKKLRDRAGK